MLPVEERKSMSVVLEDVEVVIDTNTFNENPEMKLSIVFPQKVVTNKSDRDERHREEWRELNCTRKTLKEIGENSGEAPLCP